MKLPELFIKKFQLKNLLLFSSNIYKTKNQIKLPHILPTPKHPVNKRKSIQKKDSRGFAMDSRTTSQLQLMSNETLIYDRLNFLTNQSWPVTRCLTVILQRIDDTWMAHDRSHAGDIQLPTHLSTWMRTVGIFSLFLSNCPDHMHVVIENAVVCRSIGDHLLPEDDGGLPVLFPADAGGDVVLPLVHMVSQRCTPKTNDGNENSETI